MNQVNGKKPKPSIVKSAAMIPLALQVTADENGLHQIAELTKKVAIQVFDDDKKAAEFFHEIAGYFESQHEIDQREKLEPTTWPQLVWNTSQGRYLAFHNGIIIGCVEPSHKLWTIESILCQEPGFKTTCPHLEAAKNEMQRLFEEFLKSTLKGGQA